MEGLDGRVAIKSRANLIHLESCFLSRREASHREDQANRMHRVQLEKVSRLEVERRNLVKQLLKREAIEQQLLAKHSVITASMKKASEGRKLAIERAKKNRLDRLTTEAKDAEVEARRKGKTGRRPDAARSSYEQLRAEANSTK